MKRAIHWLQVVPFLTALFVSPACDKSSDDDNDSSSSQSTATTSSSSTSSSTDSQSGSDTTSSSETSTNTSSTTGSTSSTSTETETETETETNTQTGGGACADFPEHTCPEPLECPSATSCGGSSEISKEGCVRTPCETDAQCGSDEACYRAEDHGGCLSSNFVCSWLADEERCECVSTDDCGGAYCIPKDEFPVLQCPNSPAHTCTDPFSCDSQACGDLKPFDLRGCQRVSCDNDDACGTDEACYHAGDWGGCASSHISCSDDSNGKCECVQTEDCGGGYCVEKAVVPQVCDQYQTQSECEEHANAGESYGCGWMQTVDVLTKGTCEVTLPQGRCVAFSRILDGCATDETCAAGERVYYRESSNGDGGELLINSATCGDEPLGWTQCAEGDTRPVCSCACAG